MSENNQNKLFFQKAQSKTIKNQSNNKLLSSDIKKNNTSNPFRKLKYGELRDSIRDSIHQLAQNVNKSINDYGLNTIQTFSNQLSNLRKTTLVLRGVEGELIQNVLDQGRLLIFIKNNTLENNHKWGYKTKQIVLSKDNKITTKRGNSYIEPCLLNNKQDWKKLRKSGTWKLLYNLETKIIKYFGGNLIKNSETPENESDTLVFSKDEPGIKENKIPEDKSSTFTFSKDEPGIKENKISENKSSTFTFSKDEPEIQNDYFQLIKEDEKLSNYEKISKVSKALNNILGKILIILKNALKNKNSKDELEYIEKFYFSIFGYQQINARTSGYFDDIIDIINSIDNSEENILSEMSILSKNIDKKGKEIFHFNNINNRNNKSFSSKDITYDAKLFSVINLIKDRLKDIHRSLNDKINEIKNNKTSKKK